MRALVVVCVLGGVASAQSLPGTADDPAEALAIVPAVVDIPLAGLSVRGAPGADTAIYVDGFEIPRLRHVLGLRSVVPSSMLDNGFLATAPDVSVARASAVILSLQPKAHRSELEISTLDIGARAAFAAARISVVDPVLDAGYLDGQLRIENRGGPWQLYLSTVFAQDHSTRDAPSRGEVKSDFGRITLGTHYAGPRWATSAAVSVLTSHERRDRGDDQRFDVEHLSVDSRIDATRMWRSAVGLSNVSWRIGEQSNIGRHDLDVAWPLLSRDGSPQPEHPSADDTSSRFRGVVWTPNIAAFTEVSANLSRGVRATTGARVDMFGRDRDVATQPRGELLVDLDPRTRLGLAAGAYRRAAEQGDELFTDRLNPERTTQLMARVENEHQALRTQISAYYIDRTRLVIRDDDGELHNTGLGTAYGIEGSAQFHVRGLLVWVTAALSRSTRQDFLRAAVRPSEFDQPIRTNALVSYRTGAWRFGTRVQLASGLPTTAIQQVVYDADRDVYVPIYDRTYAERLPWRSELDLRVDREIRIARQSRLLLFADVALSPSTVDYHYSADYKDVRPVRVPIVPYVGVRGTL